MSRVKSIESINKDLIRKHGGKVTLLGSTYTDTQSRATFVDVDYGEWTAFVNKVLSGTKHPHRAIKEKNYREIGEASAKKTRLSQAEIFRRIKAVHGDEISLTGEYKSMRHKTTFYHYKYGEFEGSLMKVLRGKSHPKAAKERTLAKWLKKYGTTHPMKAQKCKDKLKQTMTQKYGVDNYSKTDAYVKATRTAILPWGEYVKDFIEDVDLKFHDSTVYRWIREIDFRTREELVTKLQEGIGNTLVSEEACRKAFVDLTGKSFKKVRLPEIDKMELDGYCEELRIAFEYDGYQHFRKAWYDTDKAFEKRVKRDRKKDELCKSAGIRLIRVPYSVDNIEDYIKEKLNAKS